MSMHIEGAWLSTTNTKKRPQKITKAQQQEIENGWRERNVRLREMGLPKETLEQYIDWLYGRGKKEKKKKVPESENTETTQVHKDNYVKTDKVAKSLNLWVTGPVSSKPSPTYTGTKIKGIGTMHKSNAVPVFSDEEAKDISRMRR